MARDSIVIVEGGWPMTIVSPLLESDTGVTTSLRSWRERSHDFAIRSPSFIVVGVLVTAGIVVGPHDLTLVDVMYCGLIVLCGVCVLAAFRSRKQQAEGDGARIVVSVVFAAAVLLPVLLSMIVLGVLQWMIRGRLDSPVLASVVGVHAASALSPWDLVNEDPLAWQAVPVITAHTAGLLCVYFGVYGVVRLCEQIAARRSVRDAWVDGSPMGVVGGGVVSLIVVVLQQAAPVMIGTVVMIGTIWVLKRVLNAWETAQRDSRHDVTTGLPNRSFFQDLVDDPALLTDQGLTCVLMVDIDHFKRVNDTFGHAVGDRVLREVGSVLRGQIRDNDTLVRWGGEEFCVVLPSTDLAKAQVLAERLRRAVAHRVGAARECPAVTVSVGVSKVHPGASLESLVHEADRALYDAKGSGRNCVR